MGDREVRAASPWGVRPHGSIRGLGWNGDWLSAKWLAEALSGEDNDRISVEDVHGLLDIIESGIAARSASQTEDP